MGVTGLWKLIEPCGQPVPVEMLENKILAVDISIWLHQVVKGFQDNKGSALANAHLLGLFHRLCKLMYYRIRPVFVFDGKVAPLKRETIAKRHQKRNKLVNEADRIQNLLLQSLAKEKVVQQALGTKATDELLKASPSKNRNHLKRPEVDDMFKLPDLPQTEQATTETESEASCSSESDSSFIESKPRINYNQNLQAIDVKSKHFRNLPADIRHEILIDIKETRKQSSWGKIHELPSKSNDFSTFQMKRLLKRRQVQESIEEVEKEMDGVRTVTLSELETIFTEEGIIETHGLNYTKQISSDANTRYLLVKDLKDTLAKAGLEKKEDKLEKPAADIKTLDDEDLEKALKMSLDESAPYSASDYELTERLNLNSAQRAELKNAGVGLARAFMIEHAGMNDEDVKSLLENTQTWSDNDLAFGFQGKDDTIKTVVEPLKDEKIENSIMVTSDSENEKLKIPEQNNKNETSDPNKPTISKVMSVQKETDEIGIISDSSDSDLEEVNDISHTSNNIILNTEDSESDRKKMEIFVDLSKPIDKDDDLFADLFKPTEQKKIEVKPSPINVSQILADLKKQASEATKINLSDIKLNTPIIEISDDESLRLSQKLLYDTDSDVLSQSSQNVQIKEIPKTVFEERSLSSPLPRLDDVFEKPPNTKDVENMPSTTIPECTEVIEIIDQNLTPKRPTRLTPSKTKDISQFFEAQYVIKRTPEKIEEIEDVPKVKSPFFVKKTPKSSRKRNATDDENSPPLKSNKVNKMLFEDESCKQKTETMNKPEDVLELAANALKELKSTEELQGMVSELAKEKLDLEKERNRQDRMGMTITEKMNSECMQLLRLFGIPFIVAPMEAEAQCAFLDAIELTNGTITDDSDIWLFGGRTVYKNFFAQNKHVMEFKHEKIQSSFNVDRNKLIQLALLVGSDYTTGINGIGAVTALEILATFSTKDLTESVSSQQTSAVLTSLRNFREWWANAKTNSVTGSTIRLRLRNKLKNIEMYEGFPNPAVVEAYLEPTVDNSQESFSWGIPDVESIREFARTNFGWTRVKTDETLGPVLKRLNEKKSQATITNYFAVKAGASSSKQLAVSKRVQHAINSLSADYKSNDEEIEQTKKPKQRKKKPNPNSNEPNETTKKPRVSRKCVKLPNTTETIPQREKDQEEMKQKKKIAAKILKQSKS